MSPPTLFPSEWAVIHFPTQCFSNIGNQMAQMNEVSNISGQEFSKSDEEASKHECMNLHYKLKAL